MQLTKEEKLISRNFCKKVVKVKLGLFYTVLYEIGGTGRHFMTSIMSRLDCMYENSPSDLRGPKVHINFFEPKHIGHLLSFTQ